MRKDLAISGALVVVSFAIAGLEVARSASARAALAGRCSAQPPARGCPHTGPAISALVFVALSVTMISSMWVASGRPRIPRRSTRRARGAADHAVPPGPAPPVRAPAPASVCVDVILEATERVASSRGRSRARRGTLRTRGADDSKPDELALDYGNVLTAAPRRTHFRVGNRAFRQ